MKKEAQWKHISKRSLLLQSEGKRFVLAANFNADQKQFEKKSIEALVFTVLYTNLEFSWFR